MNNNVPVKENLSKSLIINSKTWSRDSHGLFDYECSTTRNNTFTTKKEHVIIRKKNEVRLESPTYKEENEEENLGKVYVDQFSNTFFYFR